MSAANTLPTLGLAVQGAHLLPSRRPPRVDGGKYPRVLRLYASTLVHRNGGHYLKDGKR